MKRLILLLSSVAIAASAFATLAGAHETAPCQGHGHGSHDLEFWVGGDGAEVIDVVGIIHIDDRNAIHGNGIWIYLESNGRAGLQRGGINLLGKAETCQETASPDKLIW